MASFPLESLEQTTSHRWMGLGVTSRVQHLGDGAGSHLLSRTLVLGSYPAGALAWQIGLVLKAYG